MHWLDLHPDDLIERFEPSEALVQLRQETTLGPTPMNKLDVYLHHWTLVLLQRANDPQGVQEMLTLSEIAQSLVTQDAQGHAMQQRWNGFEDLLEGKRRQLQGRQSKPPVQLKHQEPILQTIAQATDGRILQSSLCAQLQLTKGRVSQILGVLEDRALITRHREGKESWISLAPTSAAPLSPTHTQPPTQPVQHLGKNVFAWPKAA